MIGKRQNCGGGGGGGGGGKTISNWLNHLKTAHHFILMRFPLPPFVFRRLGEKAMTSSASIYSSAK